RAARQHLEARAHRNRDVALLGGAVSHGAAIAGLVREALEEAERALTAAEDWPEWEVDMRNRLAYLLFLLDDGEGSRAQSARACEVARTLPPSGIVAWTYAHHGHLGLRLGSPDHALALRLAREALDVAVASGEPLARIRCRGRLGHTLAWVGRGDDGLAELRAAVEAARRARDPLTEIELSESLFQALLLTRTHRRHGPATLADDLHERFLSRRSPLACHLPLPSLVHAFLQSGRWERAREVVELMDDRHHEGEDHVATAVARAVMSWVLGRHDDAATTLRQLTGELIGPHWYDRYYPVRIEVTADAGDLDAARRIAEDYLSLDVGDSQQAGKLGAISALVRVEAMEAAREPAAAEEHADRARAALALGEELLVRFPPLHDGSLAMETPATHLALARAELTRLTGADPHAWEVARASVDHVRYRLHAGLRLAEALLRVGDIAAARGEAAVVLARSGRIGARGLQQGAARLLTAGATHATGPSPVGRPGAAPHVRAW
ncbi:hypothetical protein PU560_05945, partial [Georgenia sp. 10Sc9-8]|nr:hypothetical protein [Georgenia halotolerans]